MVQTVFSDRLYETLLHQFQFHGNIPVKIHFLCKMLELLKNVENGFGGGNGFVCCNYWL